MATAATAPAVRTPGTGKLAVMVGPRPEMAGTGMKFLTLERGDGTRSLFGIAGQGGFYELKTFRGDRGSWAVGDQISSSGSLFVAAKADPVLVAGIPALLLQAGGGQRGMARPLEDLLLEGPACGDHVVAGSLLEALGEDRMKAVADPVGNLELGVWRLDEDRAVGNFLASKLRALEAEVRTLKSVDPDKPELKRGSSSPAVSDSKLVAWDILSAYLPEEFAKMAAERLNVFPPEEDGEGTEQTAEKKAPPAAKRSRKGVVPDEDFSGAAVKLKVDETAKMTAKQKGAAKAAAGTKSITSFFARK